MKTTNTYIWNDARDRFGCTVEEVIRECKPETTQEEYNSKPSEPFIKAGVTHIIKKFGTTNKKY